MAQARALRLPNNRGALIDFVQPGSPAERAGLKPSDVVVKLAGHDVADASGLKNLAARLDVGSDVRVEYYRDGQAKTAQLKVAELPPVPDVLLIFGFGLRERAATVPGQGSVIEVDNVVTDGMAFEDGLRPGMRVLAVGEPPVAVNTLVEFEIAARRLDFRAGLPLVVQAGEGRRHSVRLGLTRLRKQP
jgi:serine protease Do